MAGKGRHTFDRLPNLLLQACSSGTSTQNLIKKPRPNLATVSDEAHLAVPQLLIFLNDKPNIPYSDAFLHCIPNQS